MPNCNIKTPEGHTITEWGNPLLDNSQLEMTNNELANWLDGQMLLTGDEGESQEYLLDEIAHRLRSSTRMVPDRIPEWLKAELGIDEDTVVQWVDEMKRRVK